MDNQKIKTERWLYVILTLCCITLLFRAMYGFDFTDESYYLAETKRFFQGDRPFREEWFTTQIIGILLLPVYKAYYLITGSSDGIILFVRILFVFFLAGVAVLTLRHLIEKEKIDRWSAMFFVTFYLFYARAGIPTLSYYNIGLGTFLIYLICEQREGTFCRLCGGISFSVTVLCMPYMVLYFAGRLFWSVIQYTRKERQWKDDIWFYVGILISACVFLGYCLCSGDAVDILHNLPEILKDPEHQGTVIESIISFVVFMVQIFYRYLFFPMLIEFLGIFYYILKRREKKKLGVVLKAAAYVLFLAQAIYLRTFFEGGIIIAFFLLAVQVAWISGWKETSLWKNYALPGIVFGFVWILGSNVGQRVFNMGCLIACIWAVQIVWIDAKESERSWQRYGKESTVFLVLGILILIRFLDVYRDSSVEKLTVKLEEGAAKGIYTTAERAEEYYNVLKCLEKYAGEDRVLAVEKINPWLYLEAEAECGTYAAWSVDFTDSRNKVYYERYPEKIPDVIFLLNESYGTSEGWKYSSHGSNTEGLGTSVLESYLENLVNQEEYICIKESCGVFYMKN